MPKKKTGARKKSDRQKERLRGIREARDRPITEYFCNVTMVSLFVKFMVKKIIMKITSHFGEKKFVFLFLFRNVINVKGKEGSLK